ncbi:MAG: hypothetical protein ABUL62_30480 [Myxococcales bacterium]
MQRQRSRAAREQRCRSGPVGRRLRSAAAAGSSAAGSNVGGGGANSAGVTDGAGGSLAAAGGSGAGSAGAGPVGCTPGTGTTAVGQQSVLDRKTCLTWTKTRAAMTRTNKQSAKYCASLDAKYNDTSVTCAWQGVGFAGWVECVSGSAATGTTGAPCSGFGPQPQNLRELRRRAKRRARPS